MARVWHKLVPPKKLQEVANIYQGVWMPQMDRYWESEDGYTAMSRLIKTPWGDVEHLTINTMCGSSDIPWAVKQEIKDELFGFQRVAIEVFPAKKNLIDVCNVYHLWVLPKDFRLPFGIHPYRDPQGEPVERGYDFNLNDCHEWNESPERAALMENRDNCLTDVQRERIDEVRNLLDGKLQE